MSAGPSLALKGVLFGWGAFCGSHLLMSQSTVRGWLNEKLGHDGFLVSYSAVSFATLVPTAYAYLIGRGRGPKIHNIGDTTAGQWVGAALKWGGFFTTAQGVVNPAPFSIGKAHDHHKASDEVEITGIHRITRHPLFAGAAMWGLGCMLQRGHLIDVVFWGALPAFFVIGSLHQDLRNKHNFSKSYWRNTSLLPFGAVLTGQQSATQAWNEIGTVSLRLTLFAGILALAARGRLRRGFWLPHRAYKAW